MRNSVWKKELILGIIVLFIGASVVPNISGGNDKLIILSNIHYDDPPETEWIKTFGGTEMDLGNCVQQTIDGGYIITGCTESFQTEGIEDVWLIKTDEYGNEEWNNTYGGIYKDGGRSIQQTNDQGYIITGSTQSFGPYTKVLLLKTGPNGFLGWITAFGQSTGDIGYSVQQASDGGYIIVGNSNKKIWLIKTDTSGNKEWNVTFGQSGWNYGMSVQQTNDSGYIITGRLGFGGPETYDVWLIKTDRNGTEEWDRTYGGSDWEIGRSVQQTMDEGYIIAGSTRSYGAGNYDVWLIKTDKYGNEEWNNTYGGTAEDDGMSVQQTIDGGYIIAGETDSFGGMTNIWLIKTDSTGTEQWNKVFGGSNYDAGNSVQQTKDGGYIVVGDTTSYGAGSYDVWLIKVASEYQLPDPPTITGPEVGAVGVELDYTFSSTNPEGEMVSYYVEWGDGAVEDWTGPFPSGEEKTFGHTWSEIGTYNIRAKAKGIYNLESKWSDVYYVAIVEDDPPNKPSIDGKTSGKPGTEYEYTFNATDPDGDNVRYFINWGDNTDEWTDFNDSGKNVTVKHMWRKKGEYTITAKAQDIYYAKGPERTLTVTMPRNKPFIFHFNLLGYLFERFPFLEVIFLRAMNLLR